MLKLAKIFQSGMILQREKMGHLWGKTSPEAVVTLDIQGQHIEAKADANGGFCLEYQPLRATSSDEVIVKSGDDAIILENVAVGEVWLAGGQSNMEFHMRYEKNLSQVKPDCNNPNIRFYDVPELAFDGQEEAFDYSRMGIWRKATAEDIEYFSAVGYYFAATVQKELQVPVGIIGCNWGGTVSAAWMNPDTVKKCGKEWMDDYDKFAAATDMKDYYNRQLSNSMNDRGNPFADPFYEMIMPRTPSQEELNEFFAKMVATGIDIESFKGGEPMPSAIPGALYEHMLKTIAPIAVRGVLWYQGESDDESFRAHLYESMLTGLISDWRDSLCDDMLPFIIVQLPGFEHWLQVTNNRYDLIREAQYNVSKKVKNTYLCSASDMGEQFDIHPKNKKPVGERMALLAMGHVYERDVLCDAPEMESVTKEENSIVISFANAKDGLILEGNGINALKLVDEKNVEIAFNYETSGNSVKLTPENGDLDSVVKVLFAKDKFYIVNLYNTNHIPAVPFEADVD